MSTTVIPAASPITSLGHVRIVHANLRYAKAQAERMGLLVSQVYGCESNRHIDVLCRRAGPMGNHEPLWTVAEREQFAALGC
jgi:hypothetical protein